MYNADATVYTVDEFNQMLHDKIGNDVEIILADGGWFFTVDTENPSYDDTADLYNMLFKSFGYVFREIVVDGVGDKVVVVH